MTIIVQITDTHIVPHGQQWNKDNKSNTDQRLERVVNHINNLSTAPDFVIHTGDITDDGTIESYQNTKKILDKLQTKYFLTCGNHDNFNNLKQVFTNHDYFGDSKFSHYVINNDNLKIIVLDTQVEGEVHGYLCDYRIKWL
ncbi:MAG: metallophosphoesterase [Rickettsiaceae bacterium]|nr:metallophosphoesterase [Rickettsiaceae bacterium]